MFREEGIVGQDRHPKASARFSTSVAIGAGADETKRLLKSSVRFSSFLRNLPSFIPCELDEAGGDGDHQAMAISAPTRWRPSACFDHDAPGFAAFLSTLSRPTPPRITSRSLGPGPPFRRHCGLGADEQDLGLGQVSHVVADFPNVLRTLRHLCVECVRDEDLHACLLGAGCFSPSRRHRVPGRDPSRPSSPRLPCPGRTRRGRALLPLALRQLHLSPPLEVMAVAYSSSRFP